MQKYNTGVEIPITTGQNFKVKIGTGTASIQYQASTEGFDELEDGSFTASGSGVLDVTSGKIKAVLTGDAQFFMGTKK